MRSKKIPLRKCVGCNEQKPKKELIRIVKNKEDEINIDFTGKAHGRGAYLCPKLQCLKDAQKKKALNKALQYDIPDDILNKLVQELSKNG